MDKNIEYLKNFWKHKVGSFVRVSGNDKKITYVDDKYPEQVKLEGEDAITYIQDCEWLPTPSELDSILEEMGIAIGEDSAKYSNTLFKRPETFAEYAATIRGSRLIAYSEGIDLISKYYLPEDGTE